MKKVLLFIFIFSFFNAVRAQQHTTNVLFIGNSITYFNNMPQTFEAIADDKGDATTVTMYAPGGTGFINHVNDVNVYNRFRQGIWDFVVLQPGSNESPGYSETKEQTLTRLNKLKDSIMRYNPCAKILLYEISYGVWGNTQANLTTYNNTMNLIRSNCEYWADNAHIFFAPAGEAMRTAWNNDTSTMLWGSTGNVHPNAKGSYLIACSLYAAIFQKNSFGTTVRNSLTQTDAVFYQHLADNTVLNNLSDWRINTYNQFTDFNYVTNLLRVTFTSTSQNIDSLTWDFGDGTTATGTTINHTFTQPGMYTVTLTTHKGTCVETKSKQVNVSTSGINDILSQKEILFYPNPFNNKLFIKKNNDTNVNNIQIFNILGQNLTSLISFKETDLFIEINTAKLPIGLYIVKSNSLLTKVYKSID